MTPCSPPHLRVPKVKPRRESNPKLVQPFLLHAPLHRCDLSSRKCSDLMLRDSRTSVFLTLSNKVKSLILRKTPISVAGTRDLTFSFTIHTHGHKSE